MWSDVVVFIRAQNQRLARYRQARREPAPAVQKPPPSPRVSLQVEALEQKADALEQLCEEMLTILAGEMDRGDARFSRPTAWRRWLADWRARLDAWSHRAEWRTAPETRRPCTATRS